ncbi:internal scaffolding protein [Microviridae sp.]|nr:internal scaffolding protein [Microviridae sp.]
MAKTKCAPTRKHSITFDHSLSRTKQSFKDECNINNIMAKFQKTGAIDHYTKYGPQYGEQTQEGLMEAMNTVIKAEEMFAELPSSVRKRFANDPGEFIAFVEDPANREEVRKIGIVKGRATDHDSNNTRRFGEAKIPVKKESKTTED